MTSDLVIGIDCSTTSCKAFVWNPAGRMVAKGRCKIDISTPKPLWYEQSANKWWQATINALRSALKDVDLDRIAGLCIAHQRESFVPVDNNGRPLRDGILWMDERAGSQLANINNVFGKERFHTITGKPLSGNLSVVKIAWLMENEPEVYKNTSKFLDVHAFLVYKLTDQFSTSWGCADPMGLFNMRENRWASDLMDSFNMSTDKFPVAIPPGQVIGEITTNASVESGLPVGLPVVSGIGDGQAAGLGSKAINCGTAYMSLGTSVVSGYYSPTYQTSNSFRTMYGGIENSYFLETVILGGAYTISWFIEKVLHNQFNACKNDQITEKDLENLAKDTPPGAQGLLLVPYWNSAMNPYWDPTASGVMIGFRGIHGVGHIYRAILEGIAYEQRLHTYGVEQALGHELNFFIVVGGGSNSDFWCQIIADITGKKVQRAIEREASALGAGILAASALDIYSDPEDAVQGMVQLENIVFEPDEERNKFYSTRYEDVYRHIYPALRDQLRFLTVDKF